MTSVTADQPTVPLAAEPVDDDLQVGAFERFLRDSGYLVLSLPMGILTFTLLVTGWSTAAGLLITFIGIPLALLTIGVTRGLAWAERRRAAIILGHPILGRYRTPLPLRLDDYRRGRRIWARLRAIIVDRQTWKDTAYGILLLPAGIASFTIVVTMWSLTLGLLTAPAWWWIPNISVDFGVTHLDSWWKAMVVVVLGVASIPLTYGIVRGTAFVSGALARALLGPGRKALERRVERLTETRAQAVDAAQAELERIERDLHDGAQARLVAVALDLGLAEQRLSARPGSEDAIELVREARTETQRALGELRDLARGIRPALLAERGLEPAVNSLAARVGGVPTSVTADLQGGVPPAVETAAYFVVAEALTNVAKHAQASAASVTLLRRGDNVLEIDVRDDGQGGANPAGGGLSGLRKRVEALDGTLTVTSPQGGPTTLHVELPCAS